jgi:hypothetical protein
LARSDGVTFLQQRREGRARALNELILQLFWQICERHIGMNRLNVAKKLVRETTGSPLQRRDPIQHRRKQDRLHDVISGSRHGVLTVDLVRCAP